jgi:hypothetical protein
MRIERRGSVKASKRQSVKADVELTKVIHNKGPDDTSNRSIGTARPCD